MGDSLGDHMKRYEGVYRNMLTPRTPVIVRVDGKAFHTLTKQYCDKPFDEDFIDAMKYAAQQVAFEMQGFKAAYIQSDEATFLITDYDDIKTEGWFGYNHSKIVSVTASIMTAWFNYFFEKNINSFGYFDARAFNVPREDVVNNFLWRAKDWERNSLQMYARSFFSHKELNRKGKEDIHNMLHERGKNWTTDLSQQLRNGTFLIKTDAGIETRYDILPTYQSISSAFEYHNLLGE